MATWAESPSILGRLFANWRFPRPLETRVETAVAPVVREDVYEEVVVPISPVEIYVKASEKPNPFAWRRRIRSVPTFGEDIVVDGIGKFQVDNGKVNGIPVRELTKEDLVR